MLFTSKRRRSVLTVPLFLVAWTAGLILFALYRWHGVLYVLLPLVVITAFHDLRWLRRTGPYVETWEPELWAPFRRGRVHVQDAQVLVRTTAVGRQRGHELVLGAPGAPGERCTPFVTYLNKQRALAAAARAADILGLTVQDETAAAGAARPTAPP